MAVLVSTGAGILARGSTFIGQIVLGSFLMPAQVGVYGTAIGILGVTGFMRAGGVANYLPTVRAEEFRAEVPRLLGWGLICVTLGALTTLLAAGPASVWYEEPALAWALYVLAARHFLAIVALIPRMRMTVDLRFKELAALDSTCAVVKLVLTCVLAATLYDTPYAVMALAVPFASSTVIEVLYCLPASGVTLHEMTPRFTRFWQTARSLRWVFLVASLVSINSGVNMVLISRMLPVGSVGIIYFAFQLAIQPLMLFSAALTNVFAPMMARQRATPAMQEESMRRVCSGAMLFVPFFVFGAFAIFPPLEALVYDGRWAEATTPYMLLSLGACYATVAALLTGPLLGLRHFKQLAGFEAARAVGYLSGPAIGYAVCLALGLDLGTVAKPGAPLGADIVRGTIIISAGAAFAMAAVAIWQIVLVMRRFKMPTGDLVRTLMTGPAVAVLTMITAMSIGDSVVTSITPGAMSATACEFLRLFTTGAFFFAVMVVCIRFIAESTLRRTIEVMPDQLRTAAVRLLRL